MIQKTKDLQARYKGFLQTPCLWKNDSIYNLKQYNTKSTLNKINIEIDNKLRLGKYIEHFVFFELLQNSSIEIISKNIQIQQEKRTLGELDCIIFKDKKPIHLEIVYKFYLYDASEGKTEVEHFIGPDKKDSLAKKLIKLIKLKEKQLPLLYSSECEKYLKTIHLSSKIIAQQVYFKAQLFVPFSNRDIQLYQLNEDCIIGFYINRKELKELTDCKFFIPIKKDWLVKPYKNVKWQNFYQFKENSKEYLERQFSPLCWLKKANGEIEKFFLIWW